MMMKTFKTAFAAILLAVAGFVTSAAAQTTVAVSGHAQIPDASVQTNVKVRFELIGCSNGQARIDGVAIFSDYKKDFDVNPSTGAISGVIYPNVDANPATNHSIDCNGTYGTTQFLVTPLLNGRPNGKSMPYVVGPGAFNLDTAVPSASDPALITQTAVVTHPAGGGLQIIQGPLDVSALTCNLGSCSLGGYTRIQNAGTNLAQRLTANFFGGIVCADNGSTRTDCQIDTSSAFNPALGGNWTFNGITNIAGGFKINGGAAAGKIPIGDGTNFVPGDPLVQGLFAEGNTSAQNPVNVGGFDKAGTPAMHGVNVVNGIPAGTEYGIVTRPIPSGTQTVSGTVTANAGSGTYNIQANASVNETQVAGTAIDVNSGTKSAGTQRIVIATDQPQLTNALKVDGSATTQPVSGSVTANIGTTNGLALDATLTGGTTKAIDRGGAKGSTSAADVTSTASGANHQALDVAQYDASGNQLGLSATPVRTDPTGTTTQPVSGSVTANAGSGTYNIQANASVNETQVAGTAIDVNSGTKSAGTQRIVIATDQPQLTNALKVDGSATTQPVSGSVTANIGTTNGLALDATLTGGTAKARITGNAGAVMDAAGQNASSPANELLIAGQFNTTPTTITSGNVSPVQIDSTGAMKVNIVAGGGTGGGPADVGTTTAASETDAARQKVTAAVRLLDTTQGAGSQLVGAKGDQTSGMWVNCKSGCAAAGDQSTGSTALGAANAAITIPLAGETGATFQLQSAGTGVYTVTPQCSFDGGTLYNVNAYIQDPVSGQLTLTATIASAQATTDYPVICPPHATHAQMKVTAYTSGSANWVARATVNSGPALGFAAVTTAAPSPSNNTIAPVSMNTAGSVRVDQTHVAGTAVDVNSGNKSAGTQRIVIATDQPQLTNALKVDGSAVNQPVTYGLPAENTAAWTSATGINTLLSTNLTSGSGVLSTVAVTLNQTTTITGGIVSFFVSDTTAGTNQYPVSCRRVDTGSITTSPNYTYTLQASTNAAFICNVASFLSFHVKLTTVITGTGTVNVGVQASAANTDQNVVVTNAAYANLLASTSVNQMNGNTIDLGGGNTGVGTQRVVLSSNGPTLAENLVQVGGSALAFAGTGIMKVGLTDGTGNAITSTSSAVDVNIKSSGLSNQSVNVNQVAGNAVAADANGRQILKVYPDTTTTSYHASKKFAASSTTDVAVFPGNATNKALLEKITLTCTQTTAGQINVEVLKRSTADTAGTSAAITAVPDYSSYAAAVSAPLSYTGTGPTVGTAIGDLDNAQIGCMASGTATPNDIYIFKPAKPIILNGTAEQVAISLGGALTGGNITVTFDWRETTTP